MKQPHNFRHDNNGNVYCTFCGWRIDYYFSRAAVEAQLEYANEGCGLNTIPPEFIAKWIYKIEKLEGIE